MKSKKSLPSAHTHNATKFVASVPLEDVVRELETFPRLKLKLLHAYPNQWEYRATFPNVAENFPIFVSMSRWNKTETLVILNYHRPRQMQSRIGWLFILVLVVILSATSLILFDSVLAFMTIWLVWMGGLIYNKINGLGKISMSDEVLDARKKRTQEDLMNYIVNELDNSAELNIVMS